MDLEAKIETILFYRSEPVPVVELARILDAKLSDVEHSLETLSERLSTRGIVLVRQAGAAELVSAPAMSSVIERMAKEELERDLSKASLETLTIVLYLGPIARSRIDFIRGVNSTFILRSLLVRGLIERIEAEGGKRGYLYRPTFDLLHYLGLTRVDELPEYADMREATQTFETAFSEPTVLDDES